MENHKSQDAKGPQTEWEGQKFMGGASGGPVLGSGRGSQELGGARRVVAAQRRQ